MYIWDFKWKSKLLLCIGRNNWKPLDSIYLQSPVITFTSKELRNSIYVYCLMKLATLSIRYNVKCKVFHNSSMRISEYWQSNIVFSMRGLQFLFVSNFVQIKYCKFKLRPIFYCNQLVDIQMIVLKTGIIPQFIAFSSKYLNMYMYLYIQLCAHCISGAQIN